MVFTESRLKGVFVIEMEPRKDERGFFARSWCRSEFSDHGLDSEWVQCNVSFNTLEGTLRGMHYQADPYGETKLIRCTRGAVYDVVIDLRAGSPSFGRWIAEELSEENHRMLYIPNGFAHGFQTLADESELFYQMSCVHQPEYARGVRWDDPFFGIEWPATSRRIVSDRDTEFALWHRDDYD